jgi:hypothetical protein
MTELTPVQETDLKDPYFDAYGPLPGTASPATGVMDPEEGHIRPGEEPVAIGTMFLMIIFLMMIGALWGVVYLMLLNR